MSVEDVLKIVKEKEVKFIDYRFTNTNGKEQHVTVTANEDGIKTDFAEGKMFDGSSIAGWKDINESDMILMPDPSTAIMDPFFDEPTINVTCDVIEPEDGSTYEKDPRGIAKKAEKYLSDSGIADTAYFGPENELFEFDDVVETITQKLIRRHPYVFSEKRDHSPSEQLEQWEDIKQKERSFKNQIGVLDGIAKNLPALIRSQKIQKRAAKVGFNWPDHKGIFEKIKEETNELEQAIESGNKESMQEEIGDLLMILTNLAQSLNVDSEEALRGSNEKFLKRFSYIEEKLIESKREFKDTDLSLLDELWDESKKLG